MMEPHEKKGAGAAPTATGPEDAKAVGPASDHISDKPVAPEDTISEGSEMVPPAIDGADLLDRILTYAGRFICYPSPHAAVALVGWIAHTHMMDAWFTTPRLAVLSPEPGSGKSRLLEVTGTLVPRPVLSVNSSAAYILRKVADQENRPTLLIDEVDTIFGPKARGNEELRGMINAGYRRGATTGRCRVVGQNFVPEDLPTYAAIAMGGLGNLPNTLISRSICIFMRKRADGETVEDFRPIVHEPEANLLQDELAAWAASAESLARTMRPSLPEGIADRDADVWGPVITVADLAGGEWPEMVREAATHFVSSAKAGQAPSLGVQLLADIRACFGDGKRLPTADLLDMLLADEEAPWGDLQGKKLDARKLAGLLRDYGISSTNIRISGSATPKGYRRDDFLDAWRRYLP